LNAHDHFVQGDPARLQQVFWNLIKNSVKFTDEGGRISLVTSNPQPGQIGIEVSDTGIGIEADKLPKIFNAFEQGQSSITRKFGGLGLGLAISSAAATTLPSPTLPIRQSRKHNERSSIFLSATLGSRIAAVMN